MGKAATAKLTPPVLDELDVDVRTFNDVAPDEAPTEAPKTPVFPQIGTTHPNPTAPPVIVSLHPDAGPSAPLVVPLAILDPRAYVPQHVDLQLSAKQGKTLKRIAGGLDAIGQRLESGRRVQTLSDAVRWMLEQIVDHPAAADSGAGETG